jgi:hypothetical protein
MMVEKKHFMEGVFAKIIFNGLGHRGGHLIWAGGSKIIKIF